MDDILERIGNTLVEDPIPNRAKLSDLTDELRKYMETKLKEKTSERNRIDYLLSRLFLVNNPDRERDTEYNIKNAIRIIERILGDMDAGKWREHHPGDTDEVDVPPEPKEPEKTLPGGKRKKTRRVKKAGKTRKVRRGGRVDPKKEVQKAIDIAKEKQRSIDRNTFARIRVGRDISKAVEQAKGAYEGNPVRSQAVQEAVNYVEYMEDLTQNETGREMVETLGDLINFLESFKAEV